MTLDLNKVSIVRVGGISDALVEATNLIGGLKPTSSLVILKPNLCVDIDPSGGANTSIQVVRALTDMLLKIDRKSTIKIVESNSHERSAERAFENLGYYDLEENYQARGYDVSIVNLSKEPTQTITLNGFHFKRIRLPKILLEKNFFISVGKAKTHSITVLTGVLKNQFGCLPDGNKSKYHKYINEVIADLNRVIKPDIGIVDGTTGMEGALKGKLKRLGLIICGSNPVATDATLARVMGLNPAKIKHIVLSNRCGVGAIHADILGEKIDDVTLKFRRPLSSAVYPLYIRIPKPWRSLVKELYERF